MMTTLTQLSEPAADAALEILVVEDHPDSQQLVCELLHMLGHDPQGVDRAEAALMLLAQRHFDVLFTDVSLPGMSGIELARQIRAMHPEMKIIFASGHGAQIGRYFGADVFCLSKPYEMAQLQQILHQVAQQLRQGFM
jgi:CheY-like chemotaxis protein